MTIDWKKDGKRIVVILVAAALFALNIKTFVRAGGLFPGGVTGLTVLGPAGSAAEDYALEHGFAFIAVP